MGPPQLAVITDEELDDDAQQDRVDMLLVCRVDRFARRSEPSAVAAIITRLLEAV